VQIYTPERTEWELENSLLKPAPQPVV
jgi:hypothetical protein